MTVDPICDSRGTRGGAYGNARRSVKDRAGIEDIIDLFILEHSVCMDSRAGLVEIFTDITVWMGIRKIIEQVNANAVAA